METISHEIGHFLGTLAKGSLYGDNNSSEELLMCSGEADGSKIPFGQELLVGLFVRRSPIEIVKATGAIKLTQSHRWGRIITVAPDTGKVVCDIPGGPVEPQPNRLKAEVTAVTRTSERSDFILSIIGQVPPPPPCLSGMRAPTYNVGVGVHMQLSIRRSNLISEEVMVLHAAGVIENLPAFELYASVNGGRSKRVFAFGLEGSFRSSHIRFVDQADISIRNLIVIGACSGPVDL